jgi:hypothetical protein
MKVITIGRNANNDVVINDPLVSRHHLQIIRDDYGNFRLADFGSKNGTFVNGEKIKGEIRLNLTDVIRIGNTTLPWHGYFPPAPPPPPPHGDDKIHPTTSSYDIWVFLSGLVSLGLVCYIIINYFISFGNQIAGMFGGLEGQLKLFPIYLRGFFGVSGQWIPMIAAAVLAIVADFIDGTLIEDEQENGLSRTGKGMANFALAIAVIFILLAVFAEQIVKMY